MEALSGGLGGLVIDNDLEKPEVDRINIFHDFVKKKIQVLRDWVICGGIQSQFLLKIHV